jgi:hypothetical protein
VLVINIGVANSIAENEAERTSSLTILKRIVFFTSFSFR